MTDVVVTQADEERAAKFFTEGGPGHRQLAVEFAQLRLTATTPEPASGDELIERVASAIHDARYGPDFPAGLTRDTLGTTDRSGREYCYRLARAAVEATGITACQARIAVLEGALAKAHALVDCIEQRAADNLWWVNADDPETAVCETFEAICSALTEGSRG